MREIDGIEHEECAGCGAEYPADMMECCHDCYEGPFCPDCFDDHEEDHKPKCLECQKELESDPPCPVCKAELCDDCFKDHVAKCSFEHELGKEQRLLTQFPPFLCG